MVEPEIPVSEHTEKRVVDCDSHIRESSEEIHPYMEGEARRIVKHNNPIPKDGWDRRVGGRLAKHTIEDTADKLETMDAFGVDMGILFPTSCLFHGLIPDPDVAVPYARVQRFPAERVHGGERPARRGDPGPRPAAGRGSRGDRPAGGRGQLRRCVSPAHGAGTGARRRPVRPNLRGRGATRAPRHDARRRDDASRVPPTDGLLPQVPRGSLNQLLRPADGAGHEHPLPRRPGEVPRPHVRHQAGFSWIPFLYRFDKEFIGRQEEAPLLERYPSEYFKEHFYVTTQPLEEIGRDGVDHLVEFAGG